MRSVKLRVLSKIRMIVSTIIVLITLLVPAELFFRSSYADSIFMPPSYDVNAPIFDSQFGLLEAFYQQEGHVDCLVLGSSIVRVSFKPEIFENAYYKQTGEKITCFNFGIDTLSAESASVIADMLVGRFKPKLLLYSISPRSFIVPGQEFQGELLDNKWLKYVNGHFNFQGFLINNLATYRYYLRYQDWMSQDLDKLWKHLSRRPGVYDNKGFSSDFRAMLDVNLPPELSNARRDVRFLAWLEDYHPFAEDLEGLKQVASLNITTPTHIMFIEAPNHQSFMQYFGDPEQYYSNFISPVQQVADDFDVAFWRLRELYPVPGAFWNDRHHMNANGALVYSDWLGTQIGEGVNQGLLDDSMPQELLSGPPDPKLNPKDIAFFFTNPYGLNNQDWEAYQNHSSPQLIHDDAIIGNPAENAEDLRLLQYNIGVDLSSRPNTSINQRKRAFDLLHWFEEIRAHSHLDAGSQILLDQWRQSLDMQLLEEADIDYLLISDGWLMQQDEATRDLFTNTSLLEPIQTLEYRTFAPTYTVYRIKT